MTDNKDLNQRFDKLEARLDSMVVGSPFSTFQNPPSRTDEIDLKELFTILWQGKWWIIGITFLFAVAGVFYAKSLPNMYTSEGVYAPAQKQSGGGLGSQLGGLASLAGVSLGGGEASDIDQAVELLLSWPFLEQVVNQHNLKPLIIGVKGWDIATRKVIWDREIYDPDTKRWMSVDGKSAEPTSFETYLALKKMLSVNFDSKTRMVDVSVEHFSPDLAKGWVSLLVQEINEAFRARDMANAKRNIEYLKAKTAETSIAEMQAVFYGMVEVQMQKLMLAEVGDQYLLREVVPAKAAELKSNPRRGFICVLALFLGGVISSAVVVFRGVIRQSGPI